MGRDLESGGFRMPRTLRNERDELCVVWLDF